jgi:hypothetical protein
MENIYVIVSGEDWEGMQIVGVHRTLKGACESAQHLVDNETFEGYNYQLKATTDCIAEWRDRQSYIRIEARPLAA